MKRLLILSLVTGFFSSNAIAQELIIYPSDGQSKEQQTKDEGECFIWARDNSGFDPLAANETVLQSAPTTATQTRGGGMGGAARGAIVGGIVNGSDGAKDGAAIGALAGLSRQNRRNQQAEASQQQRLISKILRQ